MNWTRDDLFPTEFQREYLGTFLDEEEDPLLEVAETYYRHCHFYDLKVCTSTSSRTGEPLPSNYEEYVLINRNARQERQRLIQQYFLAEKQFHQALTRYNDRYPYIKTNYEEEK